MKLVSYCENKIKKHKCKLTNKIVKVTLTWVATKTKSYVTIDLM